VVKGSGAVMALVAVLNTGTVDGGANTSEVSAEVTAGEGRDEEGSCGEVETDGDATRGEWRKTGVSKGEGRLMVTPPADSSAEGESALAGRTGDRPRGTTVSPVDKSLGEPSSGWMEGWKVDEMGADTVTGPGEETGGERASGGSGGRSIVEGGA
jgi:hypothetical protein